MHFLDPEHASYLEMRKSSGALFNAWQIENVKCIQQSIKDHEDVKLTQ